MRRTPHPRPVAVAAGAVLAVLALMAALLSPAPVSAAPAITQTITLATQPESITAGPDGNMWVATSSVGADDLARVTPAGVVTAYDVPGVTSFGDLTTGPDGNLWATANNVIVRIPPAAPLTATTTAVAAFPGRGIVTGPDGNLWAAGGDKVLKIPPAAPATFTPYPVAGLDAREVAAGTDGRIWVADATGRVVAVDLDGTFVPHAVGGNPQGIAAGPGGQVLYTSPPSSAGLLTLGGAPQPVTVPAASDPSFSVAFALDGAYWIGYFNTGQVARVTTAGVVSVAGTVAPPFKPRHLATGPGGTVWVGAQDPGSAGRLAVVSGLEAPPPSVTDTAVSLAIRGSVIRVDRTDRRAGLSVACPATEVSGPCRAVGPVVVRARSEPRRQLNTRKSLFVAATGTAQRVELRVKPATMRRLRAVGPRGIKVQVVVAVRDAAGNTATVTKRMRLKLGRR